MAFSLIVACQPGSNKNIGDKNLKAFSWQRIHDSIPKPLGFVNDYEHLFTVEEEQLLDSMIRDFEKKTAIQIAIVTIDSMMTTRDSFEAYTLKMANTWGVGRKDKNNGVLIGISGSLKRMRIQNGYGIEKILSDAETKQIVDTVFLPEFRRANYFEGTLKGLKALIEILGQRNK